MAIVCKWPVVKGDAVIPSGTVIDDLPKEEEDRLIAYGLAVVVQQSDNKSATSTTIAEDNKNSLSTEKKDSKKASNKKGKNDEGI